MSENAKRVSPFTDELGVQLTTMEGGVARMYLDIARRHLNSGGVVHGGVLMALADCVAGAAAFSVLEAGKAAVTTDAHVTCLRGVGSGRIEAEAEVLHRGGRFLHVRLSERVEGRLIASGSISFMVVEARGH
ncbi:MAG TPA: PaaI family thioesterase [Spongiibacteraceae bacterium]|jgi:acyl-CoA thioesterase|nr:PaaI family thioesterase [Spongiibacteraceae bacterium]HUH36937.1 PaaI family thioesterase [Spongiibacteraceae bacterium]